MSIDFTGSMREIRDRLIRDGVLAAHLFSTPESNVNQAVNQAAEAKPAQDPTREAMIATLVQAKREIICARNLGMAASAIRQEAGRAQDKAKETLAALRRLGPRILHLENGRIAMINCGSEYSRSDECVHIFGPMGQLEESL
jgi:hypothetical protein